MLWILAGVTMYVLGAVAFYGRAMACAEREPEELGNIWLLTSAMERRRAA